MIRAATQAGSPGASPGADNSRRRARPFPWGGSRDRPADPPVIPSGACPAVRDQAGAGSFRRLPLASVPEVPAAAGDALYGFGRIDASGRVADAAVTTALGWRAGDRLTLPAAAGVVLARRDPEGLVAVPARPYLAIPAALPPLRARARRPDPAGRVPELRRPGRVLIHGGGPGAQETRPVPAGRAEPGDESQPLPGPGCFRCSSRDPRRFFRPFRRRPLAHQMPVRTPACGECGYGCSQGPGRPARSH